MSNRAANDKHGWRFACGVVLLLYMVVRCVAPIAAPQPQVRRRMATRASLVFTVESPDHGADAAVPARSAPVRVAHWKVNAGTEWRGDSPAPVAHSGQAQTPLRI